MRKRNIRIAIAVLLILTVFAMPVLAEDTVTELGNKINSFIKFIQGNYYKDVDTETLIEGAIKGMFNTLDKHSVYFNQKEYEDFITDVSGEFGGVGIVVEKNTFITVISPIEGTPAYRAGLKSGDEIIYVDGTDISEYSLEQAVGLMRGEPGTNVRIGIRRKGEADIIYFDIVRELIRVNPVKYEIKEDNIGYIKITQFNGQVYAKMKDALAKMNESKVKGIVIDLRDNPGGYLDEVVSICKLLIPKGPIVHIDYKNKRNTLSSELAAAPYKLVVLVNGGSASASEIMAGAIKDSGTGILIGEKTYGKGSVQSIYPLLGGGGIKITTAHYLTPSEFALDGVGLTPDIEIAAVDQAAIERDYSPVKADRALKNMMVGLDVQGVQQRLQKLGYNITSADGVYRSSTKAVVMKFEKDNNLTVDGIFEAKEQQVLVQIFEEKLANEDVQLNKAMEELKKLLK